MATPTDGSERATTASGADPFGDAARRRNVPPVAPTATEKPQPEDKKKALVPVKKVRS